MKSVADLAASRTNDEMQVMLLARRSGIPAGLGDSRAIRAAIQANLTQMMNRVRESAERAEFHT